MTQHDIDLYYRTILDGIGTAGKLVREGFTATKQVKTKEGAADLLTEYDQRVEEILIDRLRESFPAHKFIGEESTALGTKSSFTDDPTWIIDPIDGTTNFVHGFPFIAISVALAISKQVVLGIVYNPITDQLYSAIRGRGAFRNGQIIKCSGQKSLSLSQILGEYGPNRDPAILDTKCKTLETIVEKVHSIRAMGSAALNLCLVAEGSCDAYFEYGVHIWDYAAGDLIAREAGAYTCDPSGAPLNLIHRRVLCAATKELAEQMIKLYLIFAIISITISFVVSDSCRDQSNGTSTIKTWIIVISVVGGVVLIGIIAVVCCICKKCKAHSMASERKRDAENDQRMEERRVAAENRSAERLRAADAVRMKYGILKEKYGGNDYELHFIVKQFHSQWRSSLFRNIAFINQRRLATSAQEKKTSKSKQHNTLVESKTTDTHGEVATFTEKAQQAAKDTGYSLVVVAGVAALGGLCYLVLHELYSRETPNGIYKEASKMCLANTDVQDALGTPIMVHTTPQIGSMRINNVR
ncbi:unnamed protein product [Rotaria magnacalcarata]|nr:unnamed protein product [Rotaria magnacalcarata]